MVEPLIGQGRAVIDMVVDPGTFVENKVGNAEFTLEFGDGAVIGSATLDGKPLLVLASDGMSFNPRFPVVYMGVIGMEEAYKMAWALYTLMEQEKDVPVADRTRILLIVDTPGNGPGKWEEIIGMNKATGGYQLALAEARQRGWSSVAYVISRAISGAFLCHGLQADHIVALGPEYNTMIHVMPITSISRITKLDIEFLQELSKSNPVFAPGPQFFYALGGVNEMIDNHEDARDIIIKHFDEIVALKVKGEQDTLGPMGRGLLAIERNSRSARAKALAVAAEEYAAVMDKYINA